MTKNASAKHKAEKQQEDDPVTDEQTKQVLKYSNSWKKHFPVTTVFILIILQAILTVLIFFLEIGSLRASRLPEFGSTGSGVWCSIVFLVVVLMTTFLILPPNRSRAWSSYVLIAQIVLVIFSVIVTALDGYFIDQCPLVSHIIQYEFQQEPTSTVNINLIKHDFTEFVQLEIKKYTHRKQENIIQTTNVVKAELIRKMLKGL
ncbi:unnamed protein product [Didymodactylos carnosus]|uniref:Uncharacterized protein n=1 Tax=Didymodactylos carnosus TaxID=1234261 RepID=A0A8S2EJ59_9BILA|nr:unnamed protein product [Didymodactylos carnosus]CAF4005258.1 unnamed protein product [Didymodactylos carnosus]